MNFTRSDASEEITPCSRSPISDACSVSASGHVEEDGESWRNHHRGDDPERSGNRRSNISTRCAGRVPDSGTVSDLPFGSFADRTFTVVDVANLEEMPRISSSARICFEATEPPGATRSGLQAPRRLRRDELTQYAPGEWAEPYVRKCCWTSRRRAATSALVSPSAAQQFRSQGPVRRSWVTSGKPACRQDDPDELSTTGYSVLKPADEEPGLSYAGEKGQLMIRHPHFTQVDIRPASPLRR